MPASRALINGWALVAGRGGSASAAPVAPLSISGPNGTATVGDAASFTPTISGGTAPYSVAATGLPPGRSIANAATGLTTGGYTTAGSYNATYTVTDSGSPVRTASFTRSVVVSASASPSVGLAMTQLTAGRIYQRSTTTGGGANKGSGAIPVPITLTADAARLDYRLSDPDNNGALVQDWTLVANNVPANATSVSCPGVPADAKRYTLDLRPNGDNSQIVLGTSPVMMGRIIAAAGQSQMVRQFTKPAGYTGTNASLNVAISPYCGVCAAVFQDGSRDLITPTAWAAPADGGGYGSTFAAEFLRRQVATSGVACGFVGACQGATAIAAWAPGTTNNVALRSVLDAVGGFEAFHWYQGGDDAGAGTSKASYKSALDAMFADITAHNAVRGSSYTKVLTAMATRLSGGAGSTATVTAIRQAHKEWCAANSGVYLEPHDIVLEDSVHQGQPGNIVLAQHVHRALRPSLGLTGSDAGPTFGTPTRAAGSAVIYVPITLPSGATDLVLTGSAATRLTVFPAGTSSGALTISSVTYESANTRLVITLSAAPANTQALDVYAFLHPDPSGSAANADMIRDNRTDGDGISVGRSLEPSTSGPVTAAAPGEAGVAAPAVGDVFLINAYDSRNGSPTTAANWNNLNQLNYTGSANRLALVNSAGGSSPLSAYVVNGTMNAANNTGKSTGNNSGAVPDDVLLYSIFADKTGNNGTGTSTLVALTTAGFAAGTKWKVEMVGSRAVASRLQNVSVNGGAVTAVDVGNNIQISATFADQAPDGNGAITVNVTQNGSESFCYLNAVRLTRTA